MLHFRHLLIAMILLLAACSGAGPQTPGPDAVEDDAAVYDARIIDLPDAAPDLPDAESDLPDAESDLPDAESDLPDVESDLVPDVVPDAPDVEPDVGSDLEFDADPTPCPTWSPPETIGSLEHPDLTELSGLVASRARPGVLWAHNDSGDGPRLYAIDASGANLGVIEVEGAKAKDWEDIGLGPCPDSEGDCLYIGDIGDNAASRSHVSVYVVPEPEPGLDEPPATTALVVELVYPGGPRDAEALLVDPDSGDVYIIQKAFEGPSAVYRAAAPLSDDEAMEMEFIGDIAMSIVTAADVSPDGTLLLIRNYFSVSSYPRPVGSDFAEAFFSIPCPCPLGAEPQGEAIAFTAAGDGYYTIPEGQQATIHSYLLEP